jgi:hypothetical protein
VVGVVITGLYLQEDSTEQTPQKDTPTERTTKDERREPSATPEATVDQADIDREITRIDVNGRLNFPEDVPSRPVSLTISFLKTGNELPETILNKLESEDLETLSKRYFQTVSEQEPNQISREFIQSSRQSRTIRTNKDGTFRLENVPSGIYQAMVDSDDWQGQTSRRYFMASGRTETMVLDVNQIETLTGRVMDENGNSIAGAIVTSEQFNLRSRTNDKGEFVLSGIPGNESPGTITVTKPGFSDKTLQIESSEEKPLSIVLEAESPARLTVEVVDGNNNPVSNGYVYLVPLYMETPPLKRISEKPIDSIDFNELSNTRWVKRLSGAGSVTFSELRPGPYQAMLIGSEYVASPKPIDLSAGQDASLRVEAARGVDVTVRFTNQETGEPLTGIRPLFKAYGSSGRRLSPGLQISEIPEPGTVRGTLPPGTEELRIELNAEGSFQAVPKQVTFQRDDFPDLQVNVRLDERTTTSDSYRDVQFELTPERMQRSELLDNLQRAQINFWQKATPQVVSFRESGGRELFERSHSIPTGDYRIYGSFKTIDDRFVVLSEESIKPGEGTQTLSLRPVRAGSVTVEAPRSLLASISIIRLGMVPFEIQNPDGNPPGPREYPTTLVNTINPQRATTQFQYVPVNNPLNLIIRKDLKNNGGGGQTDFSIRELSPLSPGESRSITLR